MVISPSTVSYGTADGIGTMMTEGARTLAAQPAPWLLQSHLETIMLGSVILDAMAGGIIFIFSNTIMKTFAQFDDEIGINVIVLLNKIIINPLFAFVFFGGLISAYPTIVMMTRPDEFSKPARYYALASTLVFFFGEFLVTVTQNVPRNDALMAADPTSDEGVEYWRKDFLGDWVAWNTARCIASVVASVLGGLSLMAMRS